MLLSQIIDVVASDDAQTARDSHTPSFRNDVMAVLARSGCSLGTCHGNQNGKGGLKLSLRGQDPESDFVTLTRQLASRRINVLSPGDNVLMYETGHFAALWIRMAARLGACLRLSLGLGIVRMRMRWKWARIYLRKLTVRAWDLALTEKQDD